LRKEECLSVSQKGKEKRKEGMIQSIRELLRACYGFAFGHSADGPDRKGSHGFKDNNINNSVTKVWTYLTKTYYYYHHTSYHTHPDSSKYHPRYGAKPQQYDRN
jgi:hypothetical protein